MARSKRRKGKQRDRDVTGTASASSAETPPTSPPAPASRRLLWIAAGAMLLWLIFLAVLALSA
ncbi:MAG: hypothetical protein DWQ42_14305 [Planctomycetota bacterium]|nr:MAG: hypothetical protein DWQ42_14305 [Planctomycetota bacterium]REK40602.1 MAG: hypothetical protein DWQ46_15960 [Planctomycetota bacterium]